VSEGPLAVCGAHRWWQVRKGELRVMCVCAKLRSRGGGVRHDSGIGTRDMMTESVGVLEHHEVKIGLSYIYHRCRVNRVTRPSSAFAKAIAPTGSLAQTSPILTGRS
jgi:hypothetical protein